MNLRSAAELAELWQGQEAGPRPRKDDAGRSRAGGDSAASRRPPRALPRATARLAPSSPADQALRLLMLHSAWWDELSADDHGLLHELPAPHGPLFAWFENQLHEHGAQPWAALREGLRGHAHEAHAVAQLSQIPEGIEADWNEVRRIIDQLVKLNRQAEMKDLATRAATDPAAMQRYKELASKAQK